MNKRAVRATVSRRKKSRLKRPVRQIAELCIDEQTYALTAARLVYGECLEDLAGRERWTCATLDPLGRVKVLRWSGVDVMLYYKVSTAYVPEDPSPYETPVSTPAARTGWARLELLVPGRSASYMAAASRQITGDWARERRLTAAHIQALQAKVQEQAALLAAAEEKIKDLQWARGLAQISAAERR